MTAPTPTLEVSDLRQRYRVRGGELEAVAGVSFTLGRGETLGLVGESGCGKSSIGRAVLQLPPPSAGSVRFAGTELTTLPAAELRRVRRRMQFIFQDPTSALNPRRRVRDIVAEGLVITGTPKDKARRAADEALTRVGMDPAVVGDRRPHELSGGQCQRIAIARALLLEPELLICDEPVASLDVSIQGQVVNLLEDMRQRLGLAMLFISHDLAVVHNVSDRIAVMYLGTLVELGSSDDVTQRPAHPYTRALIDAVPSTGGTTVAPLRGEVPSPMNPPSGCRFRTRCPIAQDRCRDEVPEFREIAPERRVACHFPLLETAGRPA